MSSEKKLVLLTASEGASYDYPVLLVRDKDQSLKDIIKKELKKGGELYVEDPDFRKTVDDYLEESEEIFEVDGYKIQILEK